MTSDEDIMATVTPVTLSAEKIRRMTNFLVDILSNNVYRCSISTSGFDVGLAEFGQYFSQ